MLLAIIIAGLGLRLVNLGFWFHFMMDEETIAWKIRPFLTNGKPLLIGGGTPFGFHLGPAFYYLSSIPLYFANLDPISWGVLAAVFAVMTLAAVWLVGKELFSPRIGLIAALLWSTSVTPVLLDRHWWPLVLDPILALFTMFSLSRIVKGQGSWWYGLALSLSIAWQADLSTLILFMPALIVAAIRFKSDAKHILLALAILATSFLPLVIFELRHPGANLGKVFNYQYTSAVQTCSISRPDICIANIWESLRFAATAMASAIIPWSGTDNNLEHFYSWCKSWANQRQIDVPISLGVIAAGVLAVTAIKQRLFAVLLASGVFGITLFHLQGGDLYDFYLAPMVPLVILATASAINWIWTKYIPVVAVAVLTLIVGANLIAFSRLYHPQGLQLKQAAVSWALSQVGDRDFALESISTCSRYNGVRYLFMLQGKEPTASFMDPSLSWLYDRPPEIDMPELLVVFATPNDIPATEETRYNQLVRDSLAIKQFGDLSILVVNNERNLHRVNF